jgi:AcrR family transcriptional regulator
MRCEGIGLMNPAETRAQSRMSRPNDARALRSREALRQALLVLVGSKPLEEITIRDITAQAGVSYPVFFRRYATKDALLEDIATAEVRALLSLTAPVFESSTPLASLTTLCSYVNDHRPLWTGLLTGGAASAMQQEFRRIALEMGKARPEINPWLAHDLAAAVVASSLFEILAWWLRQPADYPIENIAKIIEVLIVRSTALPVDVELPCSGRDSFGVNE